MTAETWRTLPSIILEIVYSIIRAYCRPRVDNKHDQSNYESLYREASYTRQLQGTGSSIGDNALALSDVDILSDDQHHKRILLTTSRMMILPCKPSTIETAVPAWDP